MANKKDVEKLLSEVSDIDFVKLKHIGIAAAACSVVLTVVLTYFLKWIGLAIGIVILMAVTGAIYYKTAEQQKKMIHAYKSLGYTKQEYIDSFKVVKGNDFIKSTFIKMWDDVPEPEKIYVQKGKAHGVNQSKQNKKKRKYKKK